MRVEQVELPLCQVGEGPVWDVAEQALYYIDILEQKVFRWDPATGELKQWSVPAMIGSMALRKQGGAIVALVDGIHTLEFETGEVTPFALMEPPNPDIQLADGKVDRAGRFVFGTSHRQAREPIGGLYSLGTDGALGQLDEALILGNGPCFSPDNSTLYHADSMRHTIYAYDYEGGVVLCLSPAGKVEQVIEMPTRLPASCMFGGPELDKLFVPSINPSFLGREAAPQDGAMFVIEGLGATGIAEPRFAG